MKSFTTLSVINTLLYCSYTILSYGLSPLVPFGHVSESKTRFIQNQIGSINIRSVIVKDYLSGRNLFADPILWTIAFCLPLLISSLVFITMLIKLSRNKDQLSGDTPKILFRWSVVFCLIAMFAMPILVQDFWYPIGWGRMINHGVNPYYIALKDAQPFFTDLPLAATSEKMMYGPLWASFNSLIMIAATGNLWLGALMFKVLLASAWIGSLLIIRRLLTAQPIWNQAVGILVFGWMPIGIIQAVGDGHNDILMALLVLFWLYGLNRRWRLVSKLSLVGSILVKYVSAPMIFLDILHWYFQDRVSIWKYLVYWGSVMLLGVGIFALFYRSIEMFSYLSTVQNWHFYAPADAFRTILDMIRPGLPGATLLARSIFTVIFLYYLYIYIRHKDMTSLWVAAMAMIAFVLFGFNRHVWPWYIVWILGLAALTPGSTLARWVIGLALLMPYPLLVWTIFPDLGEYYVFALPALILYLLSIVWLIAVPSRWFPKFTYELKWRSKLTMRRLKIEDREQP